MVFINIVALLFLQLLLLLSAFLVARRFAAGDRRWAGFLGVASLQVVAQIRRAFAYRVGGFDRPLLDRFPGHFEIGLRIVLGEIGGARGILLGLFGAGSNACESYGGKAGNSETVQGDFLINPDILFL
jgi:hypothetical protein